MDHTEPRDLSRTGLKKAVLIYLINEQHGKCAICGTSITPETGVMDHDHETDIIRGALCKACNHGLGLFKDSIKYLEAARNYISLHRYNSRTEDWDFHNLWKTLRSNPQLR